MLDYLRKFADQHNLKWKQDKTGNLVITRPGSGGGENAPTVVIQVQALLVLLILTTIGSLLGLCKPGLLCT